MILYTEHLQLEPMTLAFVEAVLRGDRPAAEAAAGAQLPSEWPGPDLVQRAFPASLDEIRRDPITRLWGDRLLIAREGLRRIVGSVVFHGKPGEDGIAEVGYGIERALQGRGLATEAVRACLDWALQQPRVRAVRALTYAAHRASLRVIEKAGMALIDRLDHELLGELLIFERHRPGEDEAP